MKNLITAATLIGLSGQLASAALQKFTLTMTKGTAAPDGVTRDVYLVNGITPGPPIIVTEGDDLEVTIVNNIDVATTMHFHGIEQKGSNWADGVPGITQRMIEPGMTFVATFKATEHGHYWYHAHSRALYGDGIRGTFFVKPNEASLAASPFSVISNNADDITKMKNAHLNSKFVSAYDWTHWDSEYGLREWERTKTELICVDSIVINGKGRVICPSPQTLKPYINEVLPELSPKGCAYPNNTVVQPFEDAMPELVDPKVFFQCQNTTTPIEVFEVKKTDGWLSLGLVNQGAFWDLTYSIDSHKLWVYAADGAWHKPQQVDALTMPPGERMHVMVKLDQPEGDYAIRIATRVTPQVISGYAVLSYNKTDKTGTVIPDAKNPVINYGSDLIAGKKELDPITLTAWPDSVVPPKTANFTAILHLKRVTSLEWALNHNPFAAFLEEEEPIMFKPEEAANLDPELTRTYPVGSVVDVVLVSDLGNPMHPIHKHGNKAFVIGQGKGEWTWNTVAEAAAAQPQNFMLDHASLRDGFHTLDAVFEPAWVVVRFPVHEPGAIFMHCHINIHSYGGMAVALLEGPEMFPSVPMPEYYVKWNDEARAAAEAHKKKRMAGRSPSLAARMHRAASHHHHHIGHAAH
ncbi:hypothetical protein FRC03_002854 [Tulasnella sp. 419]|nr:hypothetical protein FRC02_001439 [Tulasnella sp. 418]KAG8963554.1 hypothetical protein FRC03_002854 [Tulasnella sp. 419]